MDKPILKCDCCGVSRIETDTNEDVMHCLDRNGWFLLDNKYHICNQCARDFTFEHVYQRAWRNK